MMFLKNEENREVNASHVMRCLGDFTLDNVMISSHDRLTAGLSNDRQKAEEQSISVGDLSSGQNMCLCSTYLRATAKATCFTTLIN